LLYLTARSSFVSNDFLFTSPEKQNRADRRELEIERRRDRKGEGGREGGREGDKNSKMQSAHSYAPIRRHDQIKRATFSPERPALALL
jgi:hypothetical protein